ncbi:uncharacterized protein LOC117653445 isoform X2 [Thrips palmi]|uniref:Uncharacterized protein LOC117653445 isoform X2 n=1 Tax=Thrips palmi TaxID=161013 RepID=A0A6P9ACA4_THRPL|nr:uncharacterized protein LOC117653445 isoform X2 [Thrips palmi]
MKHVFKVGDAVFARVAGFEPFPATVESVLLNESDASVFYYVRFNGGSETVPIDANNLLSFTENKKLFKFKYHDKDLRKEAEIRTEALLGAEDDIPEVLMNFVTVDSDFEEVSNETVKRLGLYSVTLTPNMVKSLGSRLSTIHSKQHELEYETEDEIVDVEDVPKINARKKTKSNPLTCPGCKVRWRTQFALEAHMRQTKCGSIVKKDRSLKQIQEDNRNKDHMMRKMWASKSASGYYNCKLCYRKFRSKGEAQAHMSSKHSGVMKNVKIKIDDNSDVSGSDSDSMSQSRNADKHSSDSDSITRNRSADKHCSLERERRRALATKFEALADILSLEKGSSKVKILALAKQEIVKLEKQFRDTEVLLEELKILNDELKTHHLKLKQS